MIEKLVEPCSLRDSLAGNDGGTSSGAQVTNAGQFPTGTGQSTQHTARSAPTVDMDQPIGGNHGTPVYMERRLRQLNAVQHKSMVDDTDKLLKLVTELNSEISRTNTSTLTPEQLRRVAEIEKLAHNVKDKMRTSVGITQDFQDRSPIPHFAPVIFSVLVGGSAVQVGWLLIEILEA